MRLPTLTGLEIRAVATFVVLVALFIAYLTWHKHVFAEGVAYQQQQDAQKLEINRKIFADTDMHITWVGNLASAERIRLQQVTIHEVQNVEKVVHDHPEMGTWYRPDELERLRYDSLATVRAAADQSAAAAAGRAVAVPSASGRSASQPAGSH